MKSMNQIVGVCLATLALAGLTACSTSDVQPTPPETVQAAGPQKEPVLNRTADRDAQVEMFQAQADGTFLIGVRNLTNSPDMFTVTLLVDGVQDSVTSPEQVQPGMSASFTLAPTVEGSELLFRVDSRQHGTGVAETLHTTP